MIVWYRDDKRDNFRLEFLCRVISVSTELLHQVNRDTNNIPSIEAVEWTMKCMKMASLWKINRDELRIHLACALYYNGYDRFAEEVMKNIKLLLY